MSDLTNKSLCAALMDFASAIANRNWSRLPMSIPANPRRDADIIIAEAAERITDLERRVATANKRIDEWQSTYSACCDTKADLERQLAEARKLLLRYYNTRLESRSAIPDMLSDIDEDVKKFIGKPSPAGEKEKE